MSLLKLGPHVQTVSAPAMLWSRQARTVKALDDPRPILAALPGSVKIWRRYFARQPLAAPADIARAVVGPLNGWNDPRLYVELYNEVYPRGDELVSYLGWLASAVAELHRLGYKAAVIGWGSGSWESADWEAARAANWARADAISLHAYWGLPPNASNPAWVLTRYNALRYREHWRVGDPPILITECGRDRVADGPTGNLVGRGWNTDGVSVDAYIKELEAFDAEISKDACVLGAVVFTAGAAPDQQPFQIDRICSRLALLSASAEPVPTPQPTPGGSVTYIDQAELDFMHKWQNERNAKNEDPSSLHAYQAFLTSVGKDASNPRHYGAMVADAPAPVPAYAPTVTAMRAPATSIQGTFAAAPKGVILHGSRSGQPLTEAQEALSTARYCQGGTGGNDLAWTASIGPDVVYVHTEPNEWGWNAGASSREYLAVEFAQPHQGDAISDAQVRAFCWAFANIWRKRWPNLPLEFPFHSCLPQGVSAGKTDLYPCNSADGAAFKARIVARLKAVGVT